MNKFKTKILSALLLAFTFFIVHDFVIEKFSVVFEDKLYSCEHVNSSASVQKSGSVTSQLHDSIHHILDIHLPRLEHMDLLSFNIKPNTDEPSSLSHIPLVPNRPPII